VVAIGVVRLKHKLCAESGWKVNGAASGNRGESPAARGEEAMLVRKRRRRRRRHVLAR
jgi:hypothetical protein